MVEWSTDKVLSLLKMYRDRPSLWDIDNGLYKDKSNRHRQLTEMADYLGETKEELERKIRNLQSHFAREIKKEKKCNYRSRWFAYKAMGFLRDKQKAQKNAAKDEDNMFHEDHSTDDSYQTNSSAQEQRHGATSTFTQVATRKRNADTSAREVAFTKETFNESNTKDEYTLFGELVAVKIRNLPTAYSRIVVQQMISTTLFDAQMGKYDNPTVDYQQRPGPDPLFGEDAQSRLQSYDSQDAANDLLDVPDFQEAVFRSSPSSGSNSQSPPPTKTEIFNE